jgi:integrase/recombinase XerD
MAQTDHPTEIDRFVARLDQEEAAAKTIANYRSDLSLFARWFRDTSGEAFAAAAVTPTDLRDYRSYLLTTKRSSPATVNRHLAALKRFFRFAHAQGWVTEDPTAAVRGVQQVQVAPKALAKREVDKLLRAAERYGSKRDLAILATLRHTGLRVGELAALRLGDVAIGERKGELVVRSGKGGKYRVVPLNLDARRAITAYQEVRPKVVDDHLFVGQRGTGLTIRAVEKLVEKYARLAGLPDVSPHTLRHTFGKHALDAGVDLVTVSRLLGHERLETTAIYTTPSAADLATAVAKLEADHLSGNEVE